EAHRVKQRRQPAFPHGRKRWPMFKILTKLAPPISPQILGEVTRIADCTMHAAEGRTDDPDRHRRANRRQRIEHGWARLGAGPDQGTDVAARSKTERR